MSIVCFPLYSPNDAIILSVGFLSISAMVWFNKVAEVNIRMQREAGKVLRELEEFSPGTDWIQILGNDESRYQVKEMFNQCIQELELRGCQ